MKRIANFVFLIGALSASFLLGQTTNLDKWWTPENDALAAAPENHKLLFENDQVRVLEVTVEPGAREPVHAHRYPSVMYYVSAAHMKEYSPGIAAVDHPRKEDGAVVFLPVGPPHQMENLEATKPLRAIRVELKNAAKRRHARSLTGMPPSAFFGMLFGRGAEAPCETTRLQRFSFVQLSKRSKASSSFSSELATLKRR